MTYELIYLALAAVLAAAVLYTEWLKRFAPTVDVWWRACLLTDWKDQ